MNTFGKRLTHFVGAALAYEVRCAPAKICLAVAEPRLAPAEIAALRAYAVARYTRLGRCSRAARQVFARRFHRRPPAVVIAIAQPMIAVPYVGIQHGRLQFGNEVFRMEKGRYVARVRPRLFRRL